MLELQECCANKRQELELTSILNSRDSRENSVMFYDNGMTGYDHQVVYIYTYILPINLVGDYLE